MESARDPRTSEQNAATGEIDVPTRVPNRHSYNSAQFCRFWTDSRAPKRNQAFNSIRVASSEHPLPSNCNPGFIAPVAPNGPPPSRYRLLLTMCVYLLFVVFVVRCKWSILPPSALFVKEQLAGTASATTAGAITASATTAGATTASGPATTASGLPPRPVLPPSVPQPPAPPSSGPTPP